MRLLWATARGSAMRASTFHAMRKGTVSRAEKALRAQAAEARKARDTERAGRCDTAADRLAAGVDFHELRHF